MMKGLTLLVTLFASAFMLQIAAAADLTNTHLLDNGLEVRLFPDRATSLTATLVVVKTGHAVDGPERLGFSHLLEHLVFAGTEATDKEELFNEVRALGGYLNGFTRDDYMGYLMVGHRDHFARQMELLSSILFRAALRDEDIDAAKEVVVEEIRRRESRPDTPMQDTFQRLLYENSPYARTGTGSEKTVRGAAADEIREHYRRHYRPGNMVLLTAGAVDDEALGIVRETFGAATAGSVEAVTTAAPPLRGRRSYRFGSSLPGLHVKIGYNGPDPRSGDAEVLELLAAVLGGPGGVLQKDLESRGFRPRQVSAGLSLHAGFSRFVVSAAFAEEEKDGALDAMLASLESLAKKGMMGAEVARARGSLVSAEILGREKLHYYLMEKAPWVVAGGPGQGFSAERWDDMGPGEVGRAAATYLADAPYAALVAFPATDEEGETAAAPPATRVVLDNGLTVLAEERPGSMVFAVNVLTRQRSALEPPGKEGIAGMLHRLLPRGTEGMTRARLEEELRETGADLSTAGNPTVPFGDFYSSRGWSFLRLQSPVEHAERVTELAAAMIARPSLNSEDVEEIAGTMADYISYREGSPEKLASRHLAEALYGAGGLGSDILGTSASVRALSPDDVAAFRAEYFTGRNLVIAVVSGLPAPDAVELVGRNFAGLPAGDEQAAPLIDPPAGPGLVEVELGRPQGALAAGAVGEEVPAELRETLSVTAAVLSERLYEQLREKEGLAYSVGAYLDFVGSRPVWTVSMGTSPDKMSAAREGVARELDRLREKGVTAGEIARAASERAGRLQMRMLSSLNRGFYLALAERYGFDHAYGNEYRRRLLAVTPEMVLEAARTHLPKDFVEVVVR